MRGTVSERFFAKVIPEPNSGCWLWLGAYHRQGYGLFSISESKVGLAHRASWYLHYGEMPDPSVKICHKCDTPSCVNPEHLWLGTQTDNMRDAVSKGRKPGTSRPGATSYVAKLTEEQALSIKLDPRYHKDIARDFDISPSTVAAIKHGTNWPHLKGSVDRRNRRPRMS